jgi:spore coat protein A
VPGFTPDTRTLLQIRVKARTGVADPSIQLPAGVTQNPLDAPYLVAQQPGVPTAVPPGVPVRRLTLNEGFDAYGRLLQQIGTDQPVSGSFGRGYDTAPTEVVNAGSVEVWEILNLSADTHPMHFHLVNVQVLSRQPISTNYAGGTPTWLGRPQAPDANELGWKETVRMNPGQATRVVMRFDLPAGLPFTVPPSPRTGGNEYVWHCHILEHEEHDMMRPLIVA